MLCCISVKANVYVDGFNLYDGLKHYERQGLRYKWLDLAALCHHELPNDTINKIRYCTARIKARDDPQRPQRQQTYIRALETIPNLTVHYGRFLESDVWMPVYGSTTVPPKMEHVIRTEEKGSDVNIATLMLCDASDGDCDLIVLITNDSDLVMPIEVSRQKFKLQVGVLNPGQRVSSALGRAATFYRPIKQASLAASQFPPAVLDKLGRPIRKPTGW